MIKPPLPLICLLLLQVAFSQQEKDLPTLKEDTTQVLDTRSFEKNLNEKYSGDEFNYDVTDGEAQNLLKRFLNWFFGTLQDTFGISIPPEAMQIMEYFIYLLMGGLVIYLLVRFFIGENLSTMFTKQAKSIVDINLSEEHIENVNLDALVKNALVKKDYRLAIRYQYLRALKMLSNQNIIDWHYEKTNWDYQKEISSPQMNSIFKEVSLLYDYIWYGEQEIDEFKYRAADARFDALKNMIIS